MDTIISSSKIVNDKLPLMSFKSRSGAFDELMMALKDDTTTLVKEVAKKDRRWGKPHLSKRLQKRICRLKLDNDPSVDVRAARLRYQLKKAKKVLVILDDIWEKQELDTLGIPSADQHKGCKILITSRRLDG
ncbi:hypothetical protein GQ457_02G040450 [Hibiscus cannabinus]